MNYDIFNVVNLEMIFDGFFNVFLYLTCKG